MRDTERPWPAHRLGSKQGYLRASAVLKVNGGGGGAGLLVSIGVLGGHGIRAVQPRGAPQALEAWKGMVLTVPGCSRPWVSCSQ